MSISKEKDPENLFKNVEEVPSKTIDKTSLRRLLRDIKHIMTSPLHSEGIYYHHCEEDMLKGYAMIIGPEDTPYYGGYYFFKIVYPTNYPHSPPTFTYCTQGDNIRFHPNFYKSGKVCVSILNTWKGEQWNSCQTIASVLLTLMTLFTKNPLLNEPGVTIRNKDVETYNKIITYKNVEVAMLHLLTKKKNYYQEWFNIFEQNIHTHFINNYNNIEKWIKSNFDSDTHETICTNIYGMRCDLTHRKLIDYFNKTGKGVLHRKKGDKKKNSK